MAPGASAEMHDGAGDSRVKWDSGIGSFENKMAEGAGRGAPEVAATAAVKRVEGCVSQLPCSNRDLQRRPGGSGSGLSRPVGAATGAAESITLSKCGLLTTLSHRLPASRVQRGALGERSPPALEAAWPSLGGASGHAAGPMGIVSARWLLLEGQARGQSVAGHGRPGNEAIFVPAHRPGPARAPSTRDSPPSSPHCPRSPRPDRPVHFVTVDGCIALLLLRLTSRHALSRRHDSVQSQPSRPDALLLGN